MVDFIKDKLRIRGIDLPVLVGELSHQELQFYSENPRIYSVVWADDTVPSQSEIFKALSQLDHVKQLVQSIKLNEGLIEPIIVRDGDQVVLEGNSRLAAYKILAQKDPITWDKILCKVLPSDIDESAVFSLLGEYHIIGKKDWEPFERAGYLHRRHFHHEISVDDLVKEVGLKKPSIQHAIDVYDFMNKNNETDINKWSYYEVYLKSRKIKKYREKYKDDMDKRIIDLIKGNKLDRAATLRDKLPVMIEGGAKDFKRFVEGKINFEECLARAEDKGAGNRSLKKLSDFRQWVSQLDIEDELAVAKSDVRSSCRYELDRIRRRIGRLIKVVEK